MKILILIIFLFTGVSAFGQITVDKLPFVIDSVGSTSVVKVTFTMRRVPSMMDLIIYTDSDNSSTVRWNCNGTSMVNAPAVEADKLRTITVINGEFWLKLETSTDKIHLF